MTFDCFHYNFFVEVMFNLMPFLQVLATVLYKLLLKFNKVFNLGGKTENRVNSMQHVLVLYPSCYFSSLEVNIGEVSKILTSGN